MRSAFWPRSDLLFPCNTEPLESTELADTDLERGDPQSSPKTTTHQPPKTTSSDIMGEAASYCNASASTFFSTACKGPNIPCMNVSGDPQKGIAPVSIKLYRVHDKNGRNNEHVLALDISTKDGFEFDLLVVQALDQDGVPTGHFIHYPCSDAKQNRGHHEIEHQFSVQGQDEASSRSRSVRH
jgi:hypothetical protein